MAVIKRAVRLVGNPRRKSRPKRRNAKHRRRSMTAKQIKFFGTKRQRAALKSRRKVAANPRRRRSASAAKHSRRRVSRRNPALVVTLGSLNPTRRKSTVARKRRKKSANPRRHARRRTSRSAPRMFVMAPRRRGRRRVSSNPRRRRAVYSRRRRNPSFMGTNVTSGAMLQMVAGGLVGVTAAKMIPRLLPAGLRTGNFMNVIATLASAVAAGMLTTRFVNANIGSAVLFGGLMQTGSVALNAFIPGLGGQFSLGELMAGGFPVPQNPIRAGIAAPVANSARVTMSGLTRAYGTAF